MRRTLEKAVEEGPFWVSHERIVRRESGGRRGESHSKDRSFRLQGLKSMWHIAKCGLLGWGLGSQGGGVQKGVWPKQHHREVGIVWWCVIVSKAGGKEEVRGLEWSLSQ
jgi:hypothetical protein